MNERTINTSLVTRVEIIDQNGREYVNNSCEAVDVHLQDDGRTMKIFIQNNTK